VARLARLSRLNVLSRLAQLSRLSRLDARDVVRQPTSMTRSAPFASSSSVCFRSAGSDEFWRSCGSSGASSFRSRRRWQRGAAGAGSTGSAFSSSRLAAFLISSKLKP